MYNVTYGISANVSQASSWTCGPDPYTYQSWILNATFAVTDGGGTSVSTTTAATVLPSEPTGNVTVTHSSGEAGRVSWLGRAWLVGACLAAGVAIAF